MILAGKKWTDEGGTALADQDTFVDPTDALTPVPKLSVCFQ